MYYVSFLLKINVLNDKIFFGYFWAIFLDRHLAIFGLYLVDVWRVGVQTPGNPGHGHVTSNHVVL